MRLVKITGPKGRGQDIAQIAFECGISDVSIQTVEQHKPGAQPTVKETVDMELSTPQARAVVEALTRAAFYDRDEYSVEVRSARSILNRESVREITRPVAPPIMDIARELWQFSHVTYSFVLRVFIASVLLGYGMVKDNPLLMVGGLVFIPLMPLVLGFAYGVLAREWKLVAQSAAAFVTATLLIALAAASTALFAHPPILFRQMAAHTRRRRFFVRCRHRSFARDSGRRRSPSARRPRRSLATRARSGVARGVEQRAARRPGAVQSLRLLRSAQLAG
jgi:hypothetical protein